MALWLELIPKIHRSDQLDRYFTHHQPRQHQLDRDVRRRRLDLRDRELDQYLGLQTGRDRNFGVQIDVETELLALRPSHKDWSRDRH